MPETWSLITVAYNSASVLRRYWTTERPANVEWIVVDNGSTDDSVEVARELGATTYVADSNLGFSRANNLGLNYASGEYVGFINPDVRVQYADLTRLAASIERVGGLVGPQLVNDDGTLQPNGRGMPLLLHKILNRARRSSGAHGYRLFAEPGESKYVFWLIGAAILGRTDTVRAMSGWNERFFLYYEDKEICIRAWDSNIPVGLDGDVQWTHGWARETKGVRLTPWIREIDSLSRFYSLYPEFLLGQRAGTARHALASSLSGSRISGD